MNDGGGRRGRRTGEGRRKAGEVGEACGKVV